MENGRIISKNLKRLAYESGKTQAEIARDLHISPATLRSWMIGTRIPRLDKIDLLCTYFNVGRADILVEAGKRAPEVTARRIPVYGRVAAGIPLEMITDITDDEEIPAAMLLGGKEYFALTIRGDSMTPRMMDGDVVIVRKQETVESGDIAIVTVGRDDATCKKVMLSEQGLTLVSLNPVYPPVFYTAQQAAKLPISILGKVVELRGKF